MPQQAINGVGCTLLLEFVERFPDFRVAEVNPLHQAFALATLRQPILEYMKQGFVVNELRRVGPAQALQCCQNLLLGIPGEGFVLPQCVEPTAQRLPLFGSADLNVQLDVRRSAQSQPTPGEVGAADDGRAAAIRMGDAVQLAVQKVALRNRADFDLLADPSGAGPSQRLLR